MIYKLIGSILTVLIIISTVFLVYSYPVFISENFDNKNINQVQNISNPVPIYHNNTDFIYKYNIKIADNMTRIPDYWEINSKFRYNSSLDIGYEEGEFIHKFYEKSDRSLKIKYKKLYILDKNNDIVQIYNSNLTYTVNGLNSGFNSYLLNNKSIDVPKHLYNNMIKNGTFEQFNYNNRYNKNSFIREDQIDLNENIASGATCGNITDGYGIRYKTNPSTHNNVYKNKNTMKFISKYSTNQKVLDHNFITHGNKYDYKIKDEGYYNINNKYLNYLNSNGGLSVNGTDKKIISESNLILEYKQKTNDKSYNITGSRLFDEKLLPSLNYNNDKIIPSTWEDHNYISLNIKSNRSNVNLNINRSSWISKSIQCFNTKQNQINYPNPISR